MSFHHLFRQMFKYLNRQRFQSVCMLRSFIGLLLFDSFLENSFTNNIISMFPTFLTFCFFVMLLLKVQKEHSYCTRYYTYAYTDQNNRRPSVHMRTFYALFQCFESLKHNNLIASW